MRGYGRAWNGCSLYLNAQRRLDVGCGVVFCGVSADFDLVCVVVREVFECLSIEDVGCY